MTNTPNHPVSAPPNPDVVVIGAGLAGLTAAATVAKAGKTVVVHEKRGGAGGQARSTIVDGFTFNQGPHAFYRGGAAHRILTELGLTIRGGQPPTKGKVLFDGKPHTAPAGVLSLLSTTAFGARDKIEIARVLAWLRNLDPSDHVSVTVNEWLDSAVHRERAANYVRALIRLATYAHQPDQLSMDVAISQLRLALGTGVLYLHDGWQTLVDQLVARPGVAIVTGEALAQLPDSPAVIIATGNPSSAGAFLNRTYDVGPEAAASCLDLGLSTRPPIDFMIGGDIPLYYSHHSAVASLAPAGSYNATAAEYLGEGDTPNADAMAAFVAHVGITDADHVTSRKLHRMVTVTAIPTASRGGIPGRPSVTDTSHDNVFIAGDWVGSTGHLADASVSSGQAAAQAALEVLSR